MPSLDRGHVAFMIRLLRLKIVGQEVILFQIWMIWVI